MVIFAGHGSDCVADRFVVFKVTFLSGALGKFVCMLLFLCQVEGLLRQPVQSSLDVELRFRNTFVSCYEKEIFERAPRVLHTLTEEAANPWDFTEEVVGQFEVALFKVVAEPLRC